jgi:hypothetical protein
VQEDIDEKSQSLAFDAFDNCANTIGISYPDDADFEFEEYGE